MIVHSAYWCDLLLPNRTKCPEMADVECMDKYGAPLRFCGRHWRTRWEWIVAQFAVEPWPTNGARSLRPTLPNATDLYPTS